MAILILAVFGLFLEEITADVSEKLRQGLQPSSSDYPGLQAPFEVDIPEFQALPTRESGNLKHPCKYPFQNSQRKSFEEGKTGLIGNFGSNIGPLGGLRPESSNVKELKHRYESNSGFSVSDSLDEDRSYLPPPLYPGRQVQLEPQYETPQESTTTLSEIIPAEPAKVRVETVLLPKLINTYLPVEEQNISSESTNISPRVQGTDFQATNVKQTQIREEHSLERLCNDPFHSFLCTPSKGRKKIDGKIRPGAKIPPNILQTLGTSSQDTQVPLSSDVRAESLSIETPSRSYLPAKIEPFTQTFSTQNTKEQDYQIYQEENRNKPTLVPSSSKPSATGRYFYTFQTSTAFPQGYQQYNQQFPVSSNQIPSIQAYSYPRPSANQIFTNLYHQEPPFNHIPSISSSAPQPTSSGYLHYKPLSQSVSPYQSSTLKPTYQPTTPTTYRPIVTTKFSLPTNSFYYPSSFPPQQVIPSSTQRPYSDLISVTEKPLTTIKPSTLEDLSYQKPSENVVIMSTHKPPGYYNPQGYTLQTTVRPSPSQTFATTTSRPTSSTGYPYPQPTNNQLLIEYTTKPPYTTLKPQVITSTSKPEISTGYIYSRPSQIFNLPTTTYPKPTGQLITTQKPRPQYPSLINNDIDIRPFGSNEYYFTQTSTQRPQQFLSSIGFSRPQLGYSYSKPTNYYANTNPSTQRPFPSSTETSRPLNHITSTSTLPQPSNHYFLSNNFEMYSSQESTQSPGITQSQRPSQTFSSPQNNLEQTTTVKPYSQSDAEDVITYHRPANSFVYPKPNVTHLKPSFSSSNQISYVPVQLINRNPTNGNNYPQPTKQVFTLSTTLAPRPTQTFHTQTLRPTAKPAVQHPYASNNQENIISNGYQYQIPGKPFTLPTRPSLHVSSQEAYSFPSTVSPFSSHVPGYSYPRPANPFQLPPRERPSTFSSASNSPSNSITEIQDLQPLRNFEILKP